MLHSVAPKDAGEDEKVIGRAYTRATRDGLFLILIPIGVAYFKDVETAILTALVMLLGFIPSLDARLFDLAIRIRRSNVSQSDTSEKGH